MKSKNKDFLLGCKRAAVGEGDRISAVTSKIKGYPFEVVINSNKISGTVLCDQMRSLDWKARNALYICKIPEEIFTDILAKFSTLLND